MIPTKGNKIIKFIVTKSARMLQIYHYIFIKTPIDKLPITMTVLHCFMAS